MEELKKILVIDDEPAFSKALSWELESQGFTVITADDGKDGLELALKERPDMIFLDVMLPSMSGTDILKSLRQDDWGKKALIVLLTEVDNPKVVAEAVENNVFKYFIKSDHTVSDIIERTKKHFSDLNPKHSK